jgi:Holliday junction DNA helicase RuvA
MIAEVTGIVGALAPDSAVVTVGGVGLLVQCTPATLATLRPGTAATLATALVVREDSLTLYGFATAGERAVFTALQTATGVGPRLAQAVLAVHHPDVIRRAVADEDVAVLCAVPGIGKKVAQRLILELRDRLGAPEGEAVAQVSAAGADEARSGLLSLGYGAREADAALTAVGGDVDPADTPAVLRAALALLRRT